MATEQLFLGFAALGALGTLVTLIAVFFRVGNSTGRFETRLDHMAITQDALLADMKDSRADNTEQHKQMLEQDTRAHGEFSRQIYDLQGRVSKLEGEQTQ